MSVNSCVCCGAIIPDGRMVCPVCENQSVEYDANMERLTRLCKNTQNGLYAPHVAGEYIGLYPNTTFSEVVERLAYYENLEEQGRLVILPCKIGSQVYAIIPKCNSKSLLCPYNGGFGATRCGVSCEAYIEVRHFDYYMLGDFGKTIFLTRKEAEEALTNGVKV